MKRVMVVLYILPILILAGCPPPADSTGPEIATPRFSIPGGVYDADQLVAITCATAGARIHYTTDGTVPTAGSAVYEQPITIAGDGALLTIKAFAAKEGGPASAVVSADYAINYYPAVLAKSIQPRAQKYIDSAVFNAVAIDSYGNMYAAGSIGASHTYNFGNGVIAVGSYIGTALEGSVNSTAVLVKYNPRGVAQWAKTNTGTFVPNSSFTCVAVDADGNVYGGGAIDRDGDYTFGGTITVAGTYNMGANAVLVKFDPFGTALWARSVIGEGPSAFNGLAVCPDGTLCAAGFIAGAEKFDFGGAATVQGQTADTLYSGAVLVKYDISGTRLWARTAAGYESRFGAVAADEYGNTYAAGKICATGNYNFGDNVNVHGTSSSGLLDNAVLVKYSPSGYAQWARSVTEGPSGNNFMAVATDGAGVYASGYACAGTYAFGPGVMVTLNQLYDNPGALVVKYDAAGNAQWATAVTPTGSFIPASFFAGVAVDDTGNVFAAGQFTASHIRFTEKIHPVSPWNNDNYLLVKFNPDGSPCWAQTAVASTNDSGFMCAAVDGEGNVFAAGRMEEGVFELSGNILVLAPIHPYNPLLAKFGKR